MEIDCGVEKAARHCPDSRRQSAGWQPLASVSLHPIGIITSFGTKKTLARQCYNVALIRQQEEPRPATNKTLLGQETR